jgi:L-threonylcarbamoyladenylate synthase
LKYRLNIDQAIEALCAGELIVYPTETFYAIGADALSAAAVERLFALKRREPDKPVALIAADSRMAFELAADVPPAARTLAARFWPGPLTIVIPARAGLPAGLLGPTGAVGMRVSPHPIARQLASALGRPITASSANFSGAPAAATVDEARLVFGDRIRAYLDGGRLSATAPSTVIAFESGRVRILREGAIARERIADALRDEVCI